MSATITIGALDRSVMRLSGGTQLAAAMLVESLRGLDAAALDTTLVQITADIPEGPLRDWLAAVHQGALPPTA